MVREAQGTLHSEDPAGRGSVEMQRPTVAPLVLALGLTLLAAGVPLGLGFLVVGGVVVLAGASLWIVQLLPGRGHVHEPLLDPSRRPRPVTGVPGGVEPLRESMPGYRLRLPLEIHPISSGIKGGLVGGLVMPIPALLWGVLSGHGVWYPVNLLAGMVLPGVDSMTIAELEQFSLSLLLVGVVIHVVISLVFGLIYGVLLPTLPPVGRALSWGGLLAPLLWTGTSYTLMGVFNPVVQQQVSWPWFMVAQLIFGIVSAGVIMSAQQLPRVLAGLLGGIGGGLVMLVPAFLWSLLSGHSLWYPVNLLAGVVFPDLGQRPLVDLEQFNVHWLVAALAVHALFSCTFGILLALIHEKLPHIPGPLAWGGLVLPLLWTGTSYGLMGVVNPVLQERVDWFWFVISQFVFGVAAAIVVHRSAMVSIPPAGRGPDQVSDYVTGEGGGRS